jgi:hypothetical protein
MSLAVFARNPKEHAVFLRTHVAVVGLGTIGGGLVDMLARAGVGRLTLIDPDTFAAENVARHILDCRSIGEPKAHELAKHVSRINPECHVTALQEKFETCPVRPDLIVSGADSFQCCSRVNSYALQVGIPAVFGGVWGEASVGEILYMVPGKTPCYECYAGFRQHVEIPSDARKYTDPTFDETRVPGQAGLWSNVLIVAGMQFQVVLGLLGLRDTIDRAHTVWLMNISDHASHLQPLAVTFAKVKTGCAVCSDDMSALEDLTHEKTWEADEEMRKASAEMAKSGRFI